MSQAAPKKKPATKKTPAKKPKAAKKPAADGEKKAAVPKAKKATAAKPKKATAATKATKPKKTTATKKPAAKKPATKKPAAKKAAAPKKAKKPAAKKPAAKKPKASPKKKAAPKAAKAGTVLLCQQASTPPQKVFFNTTKDTQRCSWPVTQGTCASCCINQVHGSSAHRTDYRAIMHSTILPPVSHLLLRYASSTVAAASAPCLRRFGC
jgi:hypothetical protein